jgi:hypothetical protein
LVRFFSLPNRFKQIETEQTQRKGIESPSKNLETLKHILETLQLKAFCVPRSQQIKLTKETSLTKNSSSPNEANFNEPARWKIGKLKEKKTKSWGSIFRMVRKPVHKTKICSTFQNYKVIPFTKQRLLEGLKLKFRACP